MTSNLVPAQESIAALLNVLRCMYELSCCVGSLCCTLTMFPSHRVQKPHLFWDEICRADASAGSYPGGQQESVQPGHQSHTTGLRCPGSSHGNECRHIINRWCGESLFACAQILNTALVYHCSTIS